MAQLRPAPQFLYDFLRQHERKMLRVYDDARPKAILKPGDPVNGTLTAGYGHTGKDVFIGLKVTATMAEDWLRDDVLNKAIKPLARKVKATILTSLTDHQYAALLAFVYNLGTGDKYVNGVFVPSTWSIWRVLNSGNLDAVPAEMARFNRMRLKKGGPLVVVQGLVNRRSAEIAIWHTPDEGKGEEAPAAPAPTSNEVRVADTPPAPSHVDPKPFAAGAAAAVAAAPAMVNQVRETLQPYADASQIVQQTISTLAAVAAALAVASLIWMWIQRKRA